MVGTFLTPGEFLAKLEVSIGRSMPVETFLIDMKVLAHQTMGLRVQESLLKLSELLAMIQSQEEAYKTNVPSKTTRTRSRDTSKDEITEPNRRDFAVTERSMSDKPPNTSTTRFRQRDETASSQQLIEEHFNKKYNSKTSDKWNPPEKNVSLLNKERRTVSSNQQRDVLMENRLGVKDKLSEKDLESYMREKKELMSIYPELKDIGAGNFKLIYRGNRQRRRGRCYN